MTPDEMENILAERGWLAIDLPDPSPVFTVRALLLTRLQTGFLPTLSSLDDYHLHATDDDRHVAILHALSTYYWELDLARTIIAANLDLFRRLVGSDLHIQRYPYLRGVRPGLSRDATPIHRDTYYGASPYELSVWIPFTDVDAEGAMRVISGSHLAPDRDFPFEQRQSEDVTMHSPKHQLGFPYAPRVLRAEILDRAEPVPLRVGQALLFGLSLVHGGGFNQGRRTRFSTDIRLANSLAPVSWSRGVRADYFVPLCSSAITRTARSYEAANGATPP